MASFLQRAKEAVNIRTQGLANRGSAEYGPNYSTTATPTTPSIGNIHSSTDGNGSSVPSHSTAGSADGWQKEKARLEQDLKKAYALIQKSKDTQLLNQLTEENGKLQADMEIMSDYQKQNAALREQMQLLLVQVKESEQERKALLQKVEVAQQQPLLPSVPASDATASVVERQAVELAQLRQEMEGMRAKAGAEKARLQEEAQQQVRDALNQASQRAEDLQRLRAEGERSNEEILRLQEALHAAQLQQIAVLSTTTATSTKADEELRASMEREKMQLQEKLLASETKVQTLQQEAVRREQAANQEHANQLAAWTTEKNRLEKQLDHAKAEAQTALKSVQADRAQAELQQQRQMEQMRQELDQVRSQVSQISVEKESVQRENEQLQVAFARLQKMAEAESEQAHLIANLQDQLQHSELVKKQLVEQFTAELQTKDRENKNALIAKEKEWKAALDAKEKETRQLWDGKEKELTAALEKKHKADKEQLKLVQKQLEDKERAMKQIQQIQHDVESDYLKRIQDLETKASAATSELETIQTAFAEASAELNRLRAENKALSDQMTGAVSRCDVLAAELDVARAGQERSSNNLQEREEAFKKLKTKYDETYRLQMETKAQCDQRDQEIVKLQQDRQQAEEKQKEQEQTIARLQSTIQAQEQGKAAQEQEVERIKKENESTLTKLQEMETEMKASERRSTMMIKDLQRQLAKYQRQGGENEGAAGSAEADKFKSPTGEQDTKRILAEVQTLARENGNLGRQLADMQTAKNKSDLDMQAMEERMNKMKKDLETKSKLVLQYAMRENAMRLQPSSSSSTPLKQENKYLPMLSNTKVTQGMDPNVLSEINHKLQGVLEDLTTKNYELEEEVRGLKDLVRKNVMSSTK